MKMHILSGGRLQMRKSVYFPGTDKSESLEMPVSCILMRHKQGNVLFDTGCHPSIASDPQSRWGDLARVMKPIMQPGDNVLTSLKAIGLGPDDIDVVVCSHLHPDHCGCNGFFTKATVIIHEDELKAAKSADAQNAGYFRADWDHEITIKSVRGQIDLMGDGRIVLLPLPGHTPGMMGATVNLDRDGSFLLASDALSVRANLDQNIIPRNTWDANLCAQSFEEIRKIEASGFKVICGHDALQWETLYKGLHAYE